MNFAKTEQNFAQPQGSIPWLRNKLRAARNLAHIYGPARRFRRFEASFHPETWARHDELLAWAERQAALAVDGNTAVSEDPLVNQGRDLSEGLRREFRNRYEGSQDLRILLHVPPPTVSSAHASLGDNFLQAFRYLGVAAHKLQWMDDTAETLRKFRPSLLLTIDHAGYLTQIDWQAIAEYRKHRKLLIGLNAALQEYGNTRLADRLAWAKRHEIDFYYSHKNPQYVEARYGEIFERGYSVFYLEFGANPLVYYPVSGFERDLNYVFLGSTNPDKWPRYYSYFAQILRKHFGYIDGPWWSSISRFGAADTHRYLCARAKAALNLHIQNQIDWPSELNERTYNLAACGVPQLIDQPKLLSSRFTPDCFFIGATPQAYRATFERMMDDPREGQRRALKAQREALTKHTIFHRADSFVQQLAGSTSICALADTQNATAITA
jgi:Glycosyl transferases group 1